MRMPKRYGQSRANDCLFCGKSATITNDQGVLVCREHTKAELGLMKCICGEHLDAHTGKWGLYFFCFNCGNVSLSKVLEINKVIDVSENKHTAKKPSLPSGYFWR